MAQGLGGTIKHFSFFLGFWFCCQQAGSKPNSQRVISSELFSVLKGCEYTSHSPLV